MTTYVLLESGDRLLLEDGSILLLELAAGAPGAPTIGTATASTNGTGNISVSFSAPADTGDSAIIDYTATTTPGGLTATGASSPLTITGATLDTAYTVVVEARNTQGSSPPSSASNSATPTDSAEYAPVVGTTTFAIQGIGGAADDPNIVSFKFNSIATRKIGSYTYQVCAFRSSTRKLVLGKRVLPSGGWTLYHYNGTDKTDLGTFELDSHNVAAAEIDADGYVHFCWDMHNYVGNPTSLNYRRSDSPLATWNGGITSALSMLGTNESGATYPMFFRDPATGTLYFMFRDGVSGNGDLYFYVWNDTTNTWSAAAGTTAGLMIQGKTGAVANAYLNGQPKFSSDWDGAGTGFMHVNWMWRMSEYPGGVDTNQDIMHVRWNGSTFTTYSGSAQTMPITIANADRVLAVGPSVDLFNQVDFDLDANNRPIVALIHNDGGGKSQLYALYHNGTSWTKTQITNYPSSTMTDFGRPCVLVDKDSNACHFIGTHLDVNANAILAWTSGNGNFSTWTEVVFYSLTGVAQYEPRYDLYVWQQHKLLDMTVSRIYASPTAVDVLEIVQDPPVTAVEAAIVRSIFRQFGVNIYGSRR